MPPIPLLGALATAVLLPWVGMAPAPVPAFQALPARAAVRASLAVPVPAAAPAPVVEEGEESLTSPGAPTRVKGPDGIQVQIFGLVPGAAALQHRSGASEGETVPATGSPGLDAIRPKPLRSPAVPLISRPLPSHDRRLALTFNGLPPDEELPAVLAALRLAGARCTFFVYGTEVTAHPRAVAALLAEGHEVGTRGDKPGRLTGLNAQAVTSRLVRGGEALVRAGFAPPRFLRPPEGQYDPVLMQAASGLGLEPVLWSSIGLRDRVGMTPSRLAEQARRAAFPGAVLMLHGDRPDTLKALPTVLAGLRHDGYSLVALGDLLGS